MYYIFINSDYIDELLKGLGLTAEEYCKREQFDYEKFQKIYNNDLSVTLRDLNKFCETFQIDMQNLLII